MNNHTQLQAVKHMVRQFVGNEYLYLDNAIDMPGGCSLWGICVGPDDRLFVMDNYEEWFPVGENDPYVTGKLFARMQSIRKQFKLTA